MGSSCKKRTKDWSWLCRETRDGSRGPSTGGGVTDSLLPRQRRREWGSCASHRWRTNFSAKTGGRVCPPSGHTVTGWPPGFWPNRAITGHGRRAQGFWRQGRQETVSFVLEKLSNSRSGVNGGKGGRKGSYLILPESPSLWDL